MKKICLLSMVVLLMVSCQSQEESVIAEYQSFYEEIKEHDGEWTEEEYDEYEEYYDQMKEEKEGCEFTSEQRRKLLKLEGKISAKMIKIKYSLVKDEVLDVIETTSSFANEMKEDFKDLDEHNEDED